MPKLWQPKPDSRRPMLTNTHRQRIAEAMRRAWSAKGVRRLNPSPNMGRPRFAS